MSFFRLVEIIATDFFLNRFSRHLNTFVIPNHGTYNSTAVASIFIFLYIQQRTTSEFVSLEWGKEQKGQRWRQKG